jgi:cyclopropane fatty-acyl-phospholipid synthase-like methyltransferase
MSRRTDSLDRAYFDAIYARESDPWQFATSDYERQKYAASLAALPDRRFAAGLEIGCSIGVLTGQLAGRCDRLVAVDVAEAALARARQAVTAAHVAFANVRVPEEWPAAWSARSFDIIVLSEVLYSLVPADIERVAGLCRTALRPGGWMLLVHYLGATDYPVSGDAATSLFVSAAGVPVVRQRRETGYRIDVLHDPD